MAMNTTIQNPIPIEQVYRCQKDSANIKKRKDHYFDARGAYIGGVPWYGPEARSSFIHVNCALVICIDDSRSTHSTESLCQHVYREFAPGKPAEDAVCESHRWVQMCS